MHDPSFIFAVARSVGKLKVEDRYEASGGIRLSQIKPTPRECTWDTNLKNVSRNSLFFVKTDTSRSERKTNGKRTGSERKANGNQRKPTDFWENGVSRGGLQGGDWNSLSVSQPSDPHKGGRRTLSGEQPLPEPLRDLDGG